MPPPPPPPGVSIEEAIRKMRRGLHEHIDTACDALQLAVTTTTTTTEAAPGAAEESEAAEDTEAALDEHAAGPSSSATPPACPSDAASQEEVLTPQELSVVDLFHIMRTQAGFGARVTSIDGVKVIAALHVNGFLGAPPPTSPDEKLSIIQKYAPLTTVKLTTRDLKVELGKLRDKFGYLDKMLCMQHQIGPARIIEHVEAQGDCFFLAMKAVHPPSVPGSVDAIRKDFSRWLFMELAKRGEAMKELALNSFGLEEAEMINMFEKAAVPLTYTEDMLVGLFGVFRCVNVEVMIPDRANVYVQKAQQETLARHLGYGSDFETSSWPTACIAFLGSHFVAVKARGA